MQYFCSCASVQAVWTEMDIHRLPDDIVRLIFQFYLKGLQQRLQVYEAWAAWEASGDPAFYGIADPPELLQVWDYYGSTDDSVYEEP